MKHGKKYVDSVKTFDRTKQFETNEALDLVIANAKAKFDETVEFHCRLGVDPKQADQQVRGVIVLPNGDYPKNIQTLAVADNGEWYCCPWIKTDKLTPKGETFYASDLAKFTVE